MATILHLSDLHFGKDHFYQPGDSDSLRSVIVRDIKSIQNLVAKPDCVVISGDLTTHGAADGLDLATRFVRDLCGDLGIPLASFVIIPGNHEVDWTAIEERKKTAHNARDLAIAGLESYSRRVVTELLGRARDEFLTTFWSDADVFVLGLNSCHFEGADYAGVGYVDPEQLVRVKKELGPAWERCRTRIAVLHHHLVPVIHANLRPDPANKSLTLNAPDILYWLGENGFQIALHGHQHQPFMARECRYPKGRAERGIIVLGAGSASVNPSRLGWIARNHYQILEVTNGRVKVLSRTRHSDAPDAFEEHQTLDLPQEAPSTTLQLSVHEAGLRSLRWFDQIPWEDYFAKATDVEVFGLSAGFLVAEKIDVLRRFLGRAGTKFTLFIYDPADEQNLWLFDDYFNLTSTVPHGDRQTKIEAVLRELDGLCKEPETRAEILVSRVRGPLLFRYTYYRFDDVLLYVPYRCAPVRGPAHIPVFELQAGTFQKNFLLPDREFLRKHFPPQVLGK